MNTISLFLKSYKIASLPLLVIIMLFPLASQAALYKCIDSSGKMTFSDRACKSNKKQGKNGRAMNWDAYGVKARMTLNGKPQPYFDAIGEVDRKTNSVYVYFFPFILTEQERNIAWKFKQAEFMETKQGTLHGRWQDYPSTIIKIGFKKGKPFTQENISHVVMVPNILHEGLSITLDEKVKHNVQRMQYEMGKDKGRMTANVIGKYQDKQNNYNWNLKFTVRLRDCTTKGFCSKSK